MDEMEYVVDESNIKKAVQSGIPLSITTYTLLRDMELKIAQTVSAFLKAAGLEKLKDYVTYCVAELAVNAKKANTKRVYFAQKGIDLNNPAEYKRGMASFKKDTIENLQYYLDLQKERGYYIKINMYYKTDRLLFEIKNNARISRIEQLRIHEKLSRSRQYNSMEDAFSHILDDSEGAGLGLVVMALMLKKMGLDENCFEIESAGGETVAKLTIPLAKAALNTVTSLTRTIAESIHSLPQFPQNIINVQRMANDPRSDMTDIARLISVDPAMTADILKLVNSAQYMLSKKVNNIAEATTILGIKGIKNLLYSYGTQKVLGDDSPYKRSLWNHSYKTAFYAYNVVKNFSRDKTIIDDVYVGGMLHDMGKIVFSDATPAMLDTIKDLCARKSVPATTLEDVAAGMNHAEIGAMVAEKWNFPDLIVAAIRFHHDPASAPPEFKDLVYAVYFANMMCLIGDGEADDGQIEAGVLEHFGITNKKQIGIIVKKFSEGFNQKR